MTDKYSDPDYPARRVFFERVVPEIARLEGEILRLKKQADCGHADLPHECHACGWRSD